MNVTNILYVSSFADPNPVNSNRTSVAVVSSLVKQGLNVKMMTCDRDATWRGALPDGTFKVAGQPVLETVRDEIPYVMVSLPGIWHERFMTDAEWDDAVQWGIHLLEYVKPGIVHLQQWHNLWWMLAAAQKLDIPTVYSVNDYGMTCQRTLLFTGSGKPCNGPDGVVTCSLCIYRGRSFVGKCNELVALIPGAFPLLNLGFGKEADRILVRHGVVRLPVYKRVANNLRRATEVLRNVSAVTVGSPFGMEVLSRSGVASEKLHINPWFHEQTDLCTPIIDTPDNLTLGFVGRISPEKGLHVLLEALSRVRSSKPVTLRIAGGVQGRYAKELFKRYETQAGNNRVEWLGWIKNCDLKDFYASVGITVVPSICMETGPLSMFESFAHKRPVLCSDISPLKWPNNKYGTGATFPYADVGALSQILIQLSSNL
ncbi:MAG: glycosyltransferase, partial [Deltaproteobacteria bacterium]